MNIRVLLLGLFGAAGMALAICVGTADLPQDDLKAAPLEVIQQGLAKVVAAEPPGGAKPTTAAEPLRVAAAPEAPSAAQGQGFDLGAVLDALESLGQKLPPLGSQKASADDADSADQPTRSGPVLDPVRPNQPELRPALPAAPAPPSSPEKPSAAATEPLPPPAKTQIRPNQEGDDQLSITIQGEDIRKVLELLSEQGGLNILASRSVQGSVSATLKNVDMETALDAILRSTGFVWRREGRFIYVGTPEDFAAMRRSLEQIANRLYRPNYVRALELQTLVTPLLTPGVGSVSITTPAEVGIGPDGNSAGGDGFAGQEALLVRDYEAVLEQIDQIVHQVDQRPTQVAIEAMILSVRLSDSNRMGIDFSVLRDKGAIQLTSGSPTSDLAEIRLDDGGLKVGFLDSSLGLFLNALETIGDTNVIATPRLLCVNKHRAQILIGAQLGYVSTTQTETSTTQAVEFLEVGTQLRLRPFIASDGMIRMEVHPELSTGEVRIEGNFTLPNKQLTQVTTNIMVRDGTTVIIGGLLRDEQLRDGNQIPFFGSLPLLGPVFRNRTERTSREEILVLITPQIVYEQQLAHEGDRAAGEFHHRHLAFGDYMNKCSRQSLSRKYFRLAQQAWAAADRDEALRLVNLAIHFSPNSRAALDLRADIWAGNPVGEHTLPAVSPFTDPPEGTTLPPWLMKKFEAEAELMKDEG